MWWNIHINQLDVSLSHKMLANSSVIIAWVRNWIKLAIWGWVKDDSKESAVKASPLGRSFSFAKQLSDEKFLLLKRDPKDYSRCLMLKDCFVWRENSTTSHLLWILTWKHFSSTTPAKNERNTVVFAWKIWLQWCYFECLTQDVLCNWNGSGGIG